MEQFAALLKAISQFAWPIVALFLIVRFGHHIEKILESLKKRKITFKVGGSELSMEEASEQQRKLIIDLQRELLVLRKEVSPLIDKNTETTEAEVVPREIIRTNQILWVDDAPKNIATIVATLKDLGVVVDSALSTSEALAKLENKKYSAIITDMGRIEYGRDVGDAGVRLVKEIRKNDKVVPIIVYTGRQGVETYGKQALANGATVVTDTVMVVMRTLNIKNLTNRDA